MALLKFNNSNWKKYFFTIWSGQIFSLLGSTLVDFALVWYMTETTGSAVVLTTATLVGMLPRIFLGPILGTLVDRAPRRLILIIADGLIALATLVLALLFWAGSVQIWHIYILLFIRATCGNTHYTAMSSATSLMVPKKQLTRVAGLNQTLNGIINVGGAPLGAFLMMILPIHSILAIDIITAAIAIFPVILIAIPEPQKLNDSKKIEFNAGTVIADLKESIQFIRSWPGMVALFIIAGVINIFLQPVFSLIPLLVSRHYHGDALQYGMVGSAIGVGIILGGILLSVWGGFKKKFYTMFLGGILMGSAIFISALGSGETFWLALITFSIAGISMPFADGTIMAMFQANIPADMQGRILAFLSMVSRIAAPIGLIAAGPLADKFDIRVWFWVGGGFVTLIFLLSLFNKNLINIEKNHKEEQIDLSAETLVEAG